MLVYMRILGGEFMKDVEPIYLDQNGYNEYLKKIEQIKKAIQENNKGRKEAFDAGAGDGWDSPEFEEIERTNMRLNGELRKMYEALDRIVIIEKHNDQEIIDIGDIILADMIFSSNDTEEMIFKLVGTTGNLEAEIEEVSINSPLGNAIYKKKIGDTCSYSVNNRNFSILLKKKLELKNENDTLIKKIK